MAVGDIIVGMDIGTSKVSLVIWIILFVLDKALLIPFFRYGGIEAWAYNNLYRKE